MPGVFDCCCIGEAAAEQFRWRVCATEEVEKDRGNGEDDIARRMALDISYLHLKV